MIRYLKQEEKRNTIPLWQEAFPEDSLPFLQYYYTEKTKDNRILTAQDEKTRKILSMLHRNPYKLQVGEYIQNADYIVAVATVKEKRHQGLMRSLLLRMMKDMYREKMGFCFLMPADVKIYEPFDFVTICEQPSLKLNSEAERTLEKKQVDKNRQNICQIAEWMNRWLEKRYQVFTRRTPEYVERLLKELESEDGWMELLLPKHSGWPLPEQLISGQSKSAGEEQYQGKIEGIRCWWGIGEKEQRMLLTSEAYMEPEEKEPPVMMARIVHLEQFLSSVKLADDCGSRNSSLRVRLKVEDTLCQENNGTFLWLIGQKQSRLCPWENEMAADESLELSIAQLTGWMFGREEELYERTPWMKQIQVLDRIFLDEIV